MGTFQGEFVETETSDGVELIGLLAEQEDTEKVVIHFHGMQGNFFQNKFTQEMLSGYPENNIAFLTVEQRGAEAVRYFPKNEEFVPIGNAYEKFEESHYDIQAWIEFAQDLGYEEIYLQSHSLGACKVAYYIGNNDHDVEGTIFLAPPDMWAIGVKSIENREELLRKAKKLDEQGKGDNIITEDALGYAYLSANTFLNLFAENTNAAVFNFYESGKGFETVKNVDVPIQAFIGTADNSIKTDPYESMEILEKESEAERFEGVVFEGAEHSFEGFEDQIISKTVKFIQESEVDE